MIWAMTTGVSQAERDASRPPLVPRWSRLAGALTLLALLAGVAYRLVLLLHDAPRTNSDEATMGLAAMHIARGQDFPVFFYGQSYMGALEAYLAAPVVAVAGPSVLALRLPILALYALFLALIWRLTLRLTGDRWFTLLVVGLLALGSDRIVKNQLIAAGGYPELNPAGVALALLTLHLAGGGTGRRLPRYAVWGLLAGLTIWVDPLLLPYLLATAAVLVAANRREIFGRAGVALGVAAVIGAAPLLLHSIRHGRNPLSAVLTASGADVPASWADRLHGGLLLGPPMGMGLCSPSHCATWQLWWAIALPVLLLVAGLTAWHTLRTHRSTADGTGRSRTAVRLALVVAAAASLAAYAISNAAGRTPVESARYLSCLAISTPALLWPLWAAARRGAGPGRGTAARVAAVAVLATLLGTATLATVQAAGRAPAARADAARHRELVATLRQLGVRHVYAEYWTCNRLTFASRERVVCAVVDERLRPGFDRYPAYRRAVERSAAPAYVAPTGSPVAALLDQRLRDAPGILETVTVAGYRVYLPRR
jgi:hypothetical protein